MSLADSRFRLRSWFRHEGRCYLRIKAQVPLSLSLSFPLPHRRRGYAACVNSAENVNVQLRKPRVYDTVTVITDIIYSREPGRNEGRIVSYVFSR